MAWKFSAKFSLSSLTAILSAHNILIVTNSEIKICQNYWEDNFEQELQCLNGGFTLCSANTVCPVLFFFSQISDKPQTEYKSLSYIIIKDSWLLFPLTLFSTAEVTGQIHSLWHSNQFSSVFLRGFSNIHCARTSFLDHHCVNLNLFWPATASLPCFISSLLSFQSQNWNVPRLKII